MANIYIDTVQDMTPSFYLDHCKPFGHRVEVCVCVTACDCIVYKCSFVNLNSSKKLPNNSSEIPRAPLIVVVFQCLALVCVAPFVFAPATGGRAKQPECSRKPCHDRPLPDEHLCEDCLARHEQRYKCSHCGQVRFKHRFSHSQLNNVRRRRKCEDCARSTVYSKVTTLYTPAPQPHDGKYIFRAPFPIFCI